MQIRCPFCREILKISEKPLGKKGICPSCFQAIEISPQNEVFENFSESLQRLVKKGLGVSQIYQKLIQENLSLKETWCFLDELYPLFSEEEKLNFNKLKSKKMPRIFRLQRIPRSIKINKSVYNSLNKSVQVILLLGWLCYLISFIFPCNGVYHICDDSHTIEEANEYAETYSEPETYSEAGTYCDEVYYTTYTKYTKSSPCPKNKKWIDIFSGFEKLILGSQEKNSIYFLMLINIPIWISPILFFFIKKESIFFQCYGIYLAILLPFFIVNNGLASEIIIQRTKRSGSADVLCFGWYLWVSSILVINGIALSQLKFKFQFKLVTLIGYGVIGCLLIFLSNFAKCFFYILLGCLLLLSISWIKALFLIPYSTKLSLR